MADGAAGTTAASGTWPAGVGAKLARAAVAGAGLREAVEQPTSSRASTAVLLTRMGDLRELIGLAITPS
jgi:hypothetical protein